MGTFDHSLERPANARREARQLAALTGLVELRTDSTAAQPNAETRRQRAPALHPAALAVQESLDLHDNGTDYQRYYPGTLVEAQPAAETVEQEASKKSLPFSSVFAESGAVLDVDPATGTVRTLDGTYTSLKAAGMTEL